MIKEQGIVEKIMNTKATVRVRQTSACEHCKSRGSCDISRSSMVVEVNNDAHAKVGDHVELSVPDGTVIKLSLIVYFFPIIALLFGAFLGSAIGDYLHVNNSVIAVIGGGIGMITVFLALKKYEKNEKFRKRYQTRMTRIIIRADSPPTGDSG
ncbi:MAG: SoxR reducing system RseC family protein [Deltaproteobacteria bacterium]|nr:SoxR reducing system RseC family protein [Deltaproteobacteria bacterium]